LAGGEQGPRLVIGTGALPDMPAGAAMTLTRFIENTAAPLLLIGCVAVFVRALPWLILEIGR